MRELKKKRRTKRNKSKVQDNNFNEENKEENNLTYNQSLNKLNSSKDFNEKKILTKLNSNNTVKIRIINKIIINFIFIIYYNNIIIN